MRKLHQKTIKKTRTVHFVSLEYLYSPKTKVRLVAN